MDIQFTPIGIIHSPFDEPTGVPIQPTAAHGIRGKIEIYPEFVSGLEDLSGFSHIILLYHFHRAAQSMLQVVPFLDSVKRGVFSTRAPSRPNPIGLSIVRLVAVYGNLLDIENVDMLDATPLLDIKPYLPSLNPSDSIRTGWAEKNSSDFEWRRADSRFDTD